MACAVLSDISILPRAPGSHSGLISDTGLTMMQPLEGVGINTGLLGQTRTRSLASGSLPDLSSAPGLFQDVTIRLQPPWAASERGWCWAGAGGRLSLVRLNKQPIAAERGSRPGGGHGGANVCGGETASSQPRLLPGAGCWTEPHLSRLSPLSHRLRARAQNILTIIKKKIWNDQTNLVFIVVILI